MYNKSMNKIKNIILSLAFTASLGFADVGEPNNSLDVSDGFLAAGDLVVVRPISSAATVGAFGIFAVVAPFTEMAGRTEETYEGLVEKTGKFSFDRDLGDFKK
jgi:hypothetical protein